MIVAAAITTVNTVWLLLKQGKKEINSVQTMLVPNGPKKDFDQVFAV